MKPMTWMEQYEVLDCCCARFAELAHKKLTYSTTFAAKALRALWNNASADERGTLATRIAVWRNLGPERVAATQQRVFAREKARLE